MGKSENRVKKGSKITGATPSVDRLALLCICLFSCICICIYVFVCICRHICICVSWSCRRERQLLMLRASIPGKLAQLCICICLLSLFAAAFVFVFTLYFPLHLYLCLNLLLYLYLANGKTAESEWQLFKLRAGRPWKTCFAVVVFADVCVFVMYLFVFEDLFLFVLKL